MELGDAFGAAGPAVLLQASAAESPGWVARGLPAGVGIAITVVLLLASWRLARRDRAALPRSRALVLAGLRSVLIALLALLLVDPAYVATHTERRRPWLVVALDDSPSMALADGWLADDAASEAARALGLDGPEAVRETPRFDLARRALDSPWLGELAERFRLAPVVLSGRPLDAGDGSLGAGRAAFHGIRPLEEGTTDLLAAARAEVVRRGRDPVAGVVLLSDGRHHAPSDPLAAAGELGLLDVPVAAVGVGAARPPRDVALRGVDMPQQVFEGEEVEARITVLARGFPEADVPLRVEGPGGTLARATARLPAGDGAVRLPIAFPAGAPGRKRLRVALEPPPGQHTGANDAREVLIDVLEGTARVLYLDAGPRWERRYLVHTWERDERVELDAWLLDRRGAPRLPEGYPRGRDALFARDVVVLGDVEPDVFEPEEREALRAFVRSRGGALVLIAGPRAMPRAWLDEPLAGLLPVAAGRPTPPAGLGARLARDGTPLRLTAGGERAPWCRLVPGRDANRELWRVLPAPRWIWPAVSARPGSAVLARAAPPESARELLAGLVDAAEPPETLPLIATRPAGEGRVLWVGFDATWRWRRRYGDRFPGRFWNGVIRWALAEKLVAHGERASAGTASAILEFPGPLEVHALLRDGTGETGDATPRLEAVVEAATGDEGTRTDATDGPPAARLRLEPIPGSGGRYRSTLDTARVRRLVEAAEARGSEPTDRVTLRVRLEGEGLGDGGAPPALEVAVTRPRPREELDLARDDVLLSEIARLSGAKAVPVERYRSAADAFTGRAVEEHTLRAHSALDHPVALVTLLLGLLAAEWVLRKLWRMV